MELYFIIAFSYALTTLYTIHLSVLKEEKVTDKSVRVIGSAFWVLVVTLLFPLVLSTIIFVSAKSFKKAYARGLFNK